MKKKSKIPTVNFGLLGEESYVTDYIQVSNPVMKRLAAKLQNPTLRKISFHTFRH